MSNLEVSNAEFSLGQAHAPPSEVCDPVALQAAQLGRRIEQASLNAWPALHQVLHDGWLLRFCNGFTRRANSVSLLHAGSTRMDERIDFCASGYRHAGLRTIFRITSHCVEPALDAALEQRGYAREDPTHVLARMNLTPGFSPQVAPVALQREGWLEAYGQLSGSPAQAQQLHGLLLSAIRLDCLFAALTVEGEIAACGLAVVEADLVGIFDVVTAPALRRRGLGEQLVSGMLAWGATQGARVGYLQVLQSNSAALRLYRRLGFIHLHDYWYRCQNSQVTRDNAPHV